MSERFTQCDDERIRVEGLLAAERAKVARLEELLSDIIENDAPEYMRYDLREKALAALAGVE
jgi:hypothetical protein